MVAGNPSGYIDRNTIKVFAESTAAVLAVCVALRRAFRINHPAIPFVLSLLLCFAIAATDGTEHDLWSWIVAFVNGCLLYCAVVGANESAVAAVTPKPVGQGEQQGRAPLPPKKFLASYFSNTPPSDKE
jgi:hypothetical protein